MFPKTISYIFLSPKEFGNAFLGWPSQEWFPKIFLNFKSFRNNGSLWQAYKITLKNEISQGKLGQNLKKTLKKMRNTQDVFMYAPRWYAVARARSVTSSDKLKMNISWEYICNNNNFSKIFLSCVFKFFPVFFWEFPLSFPQPFPDFTRKNRLYPLGESWSK